MAFAIAINGSIVPTFYELNGIQEVTDSRKLEIESKLADGEYIIGLASGLVSSLPNLTPIASFKFEVGEDTEYDFIDNENDDFDA